ncbi:MAG TPA: DNA repair exonuclease [Polyangiaceae bacterium]|nr:DNA repair exonuclease [Polyangiaceae bacterium]
MLSPVLGMKFVHAADLHLDSPLRGLARYEGAPVEAVRGATRRAFQNLIELCLEEGAAFLLIAGDIYDGDWKDYGTGLFFLNQLARLRAADIAVVLIRGNHDAQSQITKHLRFPENVHELAVNAPSTFDLPAHGVRVHGQGFRTRAVTDDLAAGYPDATRGAFNVGLLHTAVGGRPGHENYAPCRLPTLVAKGYDYWALGHVHHREVLGTEPHIVFSGNLQGRHMRETGTKGASLVTVQDGRVVAVEHRALDAVRWELVRTDVTAAQNGHDVVDLVRGDLERALAAAEGRVLAARVALEGTTAAHATLLANKEQYTSEIRLAANDLPGQIFIENIVLSTQGAIDLARIREQDDAIGQLARSIHAMKNDPEAHAMLVAELGDLTQRLPLKLREGDDALVLDATRLAELVSDVEATLIPRLLAAEGT